MYHFLSSSDDTIENKGRVNAAVLKTSVLWQKCCARSQKIQSKCLAGLTLLLFFPICKSDLRRVDAAAEERACEKSVPTHFQGFFFSFLFFSLLSRPFLYNLRCIPAPYFFILNGCLKMEL